MSAAPGVSVARRVVSEEYSGLRGSLQPGQPPLSAAPCPELSLFLEGYPRVAKDRENQER